MRYMTAVTFVLAGLVLCLVCGCKEDRPMKWVDLRYDVPQDAYIVDAEGAQKVVIRVRSTEPWEVSGTEGVDWYSISPDHGEAGKTFTVTIACARNEHLDDRSDMISIRSDYWTGKQFMLTQKGTAYLEYEICDAVEKDGGQTCVSVLSNQDWRAVVSVGGDWLDIVEGAQGSGNGSVRLEAAENKGEMRVGQLILYDRNGDAVQTVDIIQGGIMLDVQQPADGDFYKLYSQEQELRIQVESNTSWTVVKENPEDEIWYEIVSDGVHEVSGEVLVRVSEYAAGGGASVRCGTLVLATEAAEGEVSVVKKVRFKQASPDVNRTQTHEGCTIDQAGMTSSEGQPAGRYTFWFAPFDTSVEIRTYFIWKESGSSIAELRFWLNTEAAPGATELSCTPYCNDVNKWQNKLKIPVDMSNTVKIALDIMESDPDSSGQTWIYSQWLLDDVLIAQATSDGIVDRDGNTDDWKMPYDRVRSGGSIWICTMQGTAELEKWEYTSPIVWGE